MTYTTAHKQAVTRKCTQSYNFTMQSMVWKIQSLRRYSYM